MDSRFDERRDLLVLPAGLKKENLTREVREVVERMEKDNRIIRLRFIHKPATVRV
jgi:hypothetical protein